MITTILRTATKKQLSEARQFVADELHLTFPDVSALVAVAYVNARFQQGSYTAWDGFVEMLEADA